MGTIEEELKKLNSCKNLESLQRELAAFNIFEAVGMATQEIRHSFFLAYLLDPREIHGLGSEFAKRFIELVAPELIFADLSDLEVHRERWRIDLALVSQSSKFAIIVENKIWSGEHGRQLDAYEQEAKSRFRGFATVFVYLTPNGDKPSNGNYRRVSYDELVQRMLPIAKGTKNQEVTVAINHYAKLLVRRHVLTNSDLELLCQEIYNNHSAALDFLNRKIVRKKTSALIEFLATLTTEITEPQLTIGQIGTDYVIFFPPQWKPLLHDPAKRSCPDGPICLYFATSDNSIEIRSNLRPSTSEVRRVLLKLIDADNSKLFRVRRSARMKVESGYPKIFGEEIYSFGSEVASLSEDQKDGIRSEFKTWLRERLPQIVAVIDANDQELLDAIRLAK